MREMPAGATPREPYADRLIRLQTARWKQFLDIQAPFRWNLKRLEPGFTLELGCGIGRNLINLAGRGVGIDIDDQAVTTARSRGLVAFTPEEFRRAGEYNRPGRFDSLLLAHVAEHMSEPEVVSLLEAYDALVRPGGSLILIAPQEAGFSSDPTHVQMMDFVRLARIAERRGFVPVRTFSFPFPRWMGRWFKYNEFVVVARKADDETARERDRRELERRHDAAGSARVAGRSDLA
jgi:SAM-dependent methyltransferase